MSGPSIWATLGIEATRDRATIRRAYAARLKVTSPEDDPAGFQALRAAYERALAYAGPEVRTPRRVQPKPEPEAQPEPEPEAQKEEQPEREGEGKLEVETGGEPKPRSHDWRPPDDPKAPEPSERPERTHDWRGPDAKADPPRRRARAWRPPQIQEPVEVFDAAARDDFTARELALARALADAGAAPATRLAALDAYLASPLLEEMARHAAAERWLAQMIALNAPRSDCLIDRVAAHFGWDEKRVGPRSDVGARVLARREDLRFLAATQAVTSPHRGALEALTRKPVGWRRIANRVTPQLSERVKALLAVLRTQRPGVMSTLDPDAIAWWETYQGRPRLGPLSLWALLLLPALAALLAWGGRRSAGNALVVGAMVLTAVAGFIAVSLYGVQWPRQLWRRRWARTAPAWIGLGWAPALATLVIASAAVPPSDTVSLALLAAACAALLWAVAVGDFDRRDVGQVAPPFAWRGPIFSFPIAFAVYAAYWGTLRPGVRFSWQVRTILSFAYLGMFWWVAADDLPNAVVGQTAGPLIAACLGYSVGAGALIDAWARAPAARRRAWLAGVAALAVAALGALWLAGPYPQARPLAEALVAAAVLGHKAPAAALGETAGRIRDLLMRFGWLAFFWVGLNLKDIVDAGWIGAPLLAAAETATLAIAARPGEGGWRGWLGRLGDLALRYGWVGVLPVLFVLMAAPGVVALVGGALWMLLGVGATVSGLAPAPWTQGPHRRA